MTRTVPQALGHTPAARVSNRDEGDSPETAPCTAHDRSLAALDRRCDILQAAPVKHPRKGVVSVRK